MSAPSCPKIERESQKRAKGGFWHVTIYIHIWCVCLCMWHTTSHMIERWWTWKLKSKVGGLYLSNDLSFPPPLWPVALSNGAKQFLRWCFWNKRTRDGWFLHNFQLSSADFGGGGSWKFQWNSGVSLQRFEFVWAGFKSHKERGKDLVFIGFTITSLNKTTPMDIGTIWNSFLYLLANSQVKL